MLKDWLLQPLTKLKTRADGDSLAIVIIQISQRSVGMRFEGAVVLGDGNLNDTIACLTVQIATVFRLSAVFRDMLDAGLTRERVGASCWSRILRPCLLILLRER